MINRRTFGKALGVAVASLTGPQGSRSASAIIRSGPRTPADPGPHPSLGSLKQVRAGLLNIGYAEAGPANGPVVICLHGWPYDIHSFVDVAPLLAAQGHRVIVPYLRGHGTTRFLSSRTVRNAQQSVIALDIIALMDALKVDNPDYAAIVIHNYRWRLSLADGERRYDGLEKRLAARPVIKVPTTTLDAERGPFTAPGDGSSYRDMFTGAYEHRTLRGIGHNLPQEAPTAFARAVADVDHF
jgi:pimeloyl-ACP methyl ester carboxylesterase